MMYFCEFPGCDYCTSVKAQVNNHHIVPKELGGSDKSGNRAFLCPTHHTKIYVRGAKNGIHSIKGEDSIQIGGWYRSTGGYMLQYIDQDGEVKYSSKKNIIENKRR